MKTPKSVWLARYGVAYEGYVVIGAYFTREQATARLNILRELKNSGHLLGVDSLDVIEIPLNESKPLWQEIQAIKDSASEKYAVD